MGSWSAVRKWLEEEMLCDSLKGRVRYNLTRYANMGMLCGLFEIYVDKKLVKQFSWETIGAEAKALSGKVGGSTEFWELMWKHKEDDERNEYDDGEFAEALAEYRNSDIISSINSKNPIVRMFAILDRRIGKRTLVKIIETLEDQPDWLKSFYELRIESEGIRL